MPLDAPPVGEPLTVGTAQFQMWALGRDIVVVPQTGEVRIDWDAVSAAAEDPTTYVGAISRALLAARDGTWKPLEKKQ
jgi:hypothetical protein